MTRTDAASDFAADDPPMIGAMPRFRFAVRADSFARRTAADDLTVPGGAADHERGGFPQVAKG